ncbi:hypothetical protein LIER_43577 [Lithospermum erythrorhizon]|uniref:DUF4283 domain-containing protein n=1 Tax=Lithospermum erythrorhizon TaxID=34254 RepID=A0AAV3QGC4_LITER
MADGEAPQPPPPLEDGVSKPLFQSYSHNSFATIGQGPLFNRQLQIDRHVDEAHLKPISVFQGKPSVIFKASEKLNLLGKMNFVLVGKFSHGRPPLVKIKAFLTALKLQGSYNVSIFDHKHVFIEFNFKADFNRVWLGLAWSIHGYTMRVFKWAADFSPNRESATAPVWVRFEGIPLFLFDEVSLMSIANAVGNPLRVDPKNLNRTKLNYAHVCVELDVAAPLVDSIWVGFEEDDSQIILEGIWIKVIYDVIPPFCTACFHIGHVMGMCKRGKLVVKNSLGAGSERMADADKVFDTLSQRESATLGTEGQGVEKVFDQRPHTRMTTAPQAGRKPGSFSTQPGTKQITLRGWKAVKNLDLKDVDLGGKQETMNQALLTQELGANETFSTAQGHCSVSGSTGQVARIVVDNRSELTGIEEQPVTEASTVVQSMPSALLEDHGLQVNVKSVSEGKNGGEDSGSLVADQVLDNLPQPGYSTKSAQSEVHSVLLHGKAKSFQEVSQPEEESVEAKVFDKLTHSSPQSDSPSGNLAENITAMEGNKGEPHGTFAEVQFDVQNESQQQGVGNETTFTPLMDIEKISCKENKALILELDNNASNMESQVKVILKYVDDLKKKIDNADSTTIARIASSPSTKAFLKNQNVAGVRDNSNEPPITVLPKLCYEQVSKQKTWSSTVQIAHLGEGPGIVKTALLQLKDKGQILTRGQGHPFDDNG